VAAAAPLLAGRDLGIRSPTGSGKTLACLLPLMTLALRGEQSAGRIDLQEHRRWSRRAGTADDNDVAILVVSPSRELCMQTVRVLRSLLPPGWSRGVQQLIGGANPHRQTDQLKLHRPFVVVGTPGRVAELDARGVLGLHRVRRVEAALCLSLSPSFDSLYPSVLR